MNTTGTVAHDLRDLLLPADALLQRGERHRPAVAEGQHLAVEHGAVGQVRRGRGDFRKAMRDQLLAARPQPRLAARRIELRADAVPFPFDQPVGAIAERLGRPLERRRRGRTDRAATGPRRRLAGATRLCEPLRRRRPVAHQCAPRSSSAPRPPRSASAPHDQRLRHADAELAGEQLVEEEALARGSPQPPPAPASRCAAGSAFCSGSSRSSTQSASGRSGSRRRRAARVSSSERNQLGEVARPPSSTRRAASPGRR